MGKVYPEEVKRKAVELYRLDDDVTYAQVGRDLGGISGETIRNWCLCRPLHKTHLSRFFGVVHQKAATWLRCQISRSRPSRWCMGGAPSGRC